MHALTPAQAQFPGYFSPPDPHMAPVPPRHIPQGPFSHVPSGYGRAPRVVFLPPEAMRHRLALQGFSVSKIWRRGEVYLAEGFDRRRNFVRIAAEPYEGSILEVTALRSPSPMVPRQGLAYQALGPQERDEPAPRIRERARRAPQATVTRSQKAVDEEDEDEVMPVRPRTKRQAHIAARPSPVSAPVSVREKTVSPKQKTQDTPLTKAPEPLPSEARSTSSPDSKTSPAKPQTPVKKIAKLPAVGPIPLPKDPNAPQPAVSPVEEVKPAPSTKQGRS
jgi:hypothetical protein